VEEGRLGLVGTRQDQVDTATDRGTDLIDLAHPRREQAAAALVGRDQQGVRGVDVVETSDLVELGVRAGGREVACLAHRAHRAGDRIERVEDADHVVAGATGGVLGDEQPSGTPVRGRVGPVGHGLWREPELEGEAEAEVQRSSRTGEHEGGQEGQRSQRELE